MHVCIRVSILPLYTNFEWWLLFTVPYMLPCIQSSSGRIKPKTMKLAFVFTCSTNVKVQRLVGSKSGYCVRVKERVYPWTIVSVSKEWWSSTMRILLIISSISTFSPWDSQSIVYVSLNNNNITSRKYSICRTHSYCNFDTCYFKYPFTRVLIIYAYFINKS
jgi:hypothetical protein